MRILIDGYNLIRRVPDLALLDREDLEAGRERLVAELSEYRSAKGHRITVVFDGAGSGRLGASRENIRGISVVYSPAGRSADDILRSMCLGGEADLLVTADREVAQAANSRRITVVEPEGFWGRLEAERMRKLKGLEEEEERPPHRPGRKPSKRRRQDIKRLTRL